MQLNLFYVKYWPESDPDVGKNVLPCTVKNPTVILINSCFDGNYMLICNNRQDGMSKTKQCLCFPAKRVFFLLVTGATFFFGGGRGFSSSFHSKTLCFLQLIYSPKS